MYTLTFFIDYANNPDWRTKKLKEKYIEQSVLLNMQESYANFSIDQTSALIEESKIFIHKFLNYKLQQTDEQIVKLRHALDCANLLKRVVLTLTELKNLENYCEKIFQDVNDDSRLIEKAFHKIKKENWNISVDTFSYRLEIQENV